MQATDRNPTEEEVRKLLEDIYEQRRVTDAPTEVTPPSLSLQERLADATVELRGNLKVKGVLGMLAKRYGIGRDTVGTYKKLFIKELQRDPPISDDSLRRMVLREAQARDK